MDGWLCNRYLPTYIHTYVEIEIDGEGLAVGRTRKGEREGRER